MDVGSDCGLGEAVVLTCLTPGCPRYGWAMAVARMLIENGLARKCPDCGLARVGSRSGHIRESIGEM